MILLDDLQVALAAYHVHQITTPGGIKATGGVEDVVGHLIHARPRDDTANLSFFAKGDDVRLDPHVLDGPHFAGSAHAALYFVHDEQEVVLIGQAPKLGEKFRPKVIVPTLALDRLDDQSGNIVWVGAHGLLDLGHGLGFCFDRFGQDLIGDGEAQFRVDDARPVESGEVHVLARVGCVG